MKYSLVVQIKTNTTNLPRNNLEYTKFQTNKIPIQTQQKENTIKYQSTVSNGVTFAHSQMMF